MVLDAEGVIVAVNPAFRRITGFSEREPLGRPCSVLACSACPAPGQGGGCVLAGGAAGETISCRMSHKSGRTLRLLKRASLLTAADGSILGAVETLLEASDLEATPPPRAYDERMRLVGRSPAMAALLDSLEGLAKGAAPILIQGESGAGKELVASLLHRLGPRSGEKLIKLSCASLQPQDLAGGPWQRAHGPEADIILDEISDLPPASQKRLAEYLGQRQPPELKVLALSNQDLGLLVGRGRFDQDLWRRLRPVTLNVPPLRERREDLPPLLERLLADLCQRRGRPAARLGREALRLIQAHAWPGNVRELINALEYALMLAPQGEIQAAHLPPALNGAAYPLAKQAAEGDDRQRLLQALRTAGGNQSEAARILGVSRVTVWKRMQKYGIDVSQL
ncbi:hypothetical protein AAU61_12395 [Desulfocarbo indianensis]|nr:hypothetical protein AAU61_12395 [Desulfocarbo indianensis]